jgi:hypothetical protein
MLSWRASCIRKRIESLKTEIDRVSAKHHPYPTPKLLYTALDGVLDQIRVRLNRDEAIYTPSDDPFDARLFASSLSSCEADLNTAVRLFRNCDRVDSSRIPFEILNALTTTAQQVLGAPYQLIFHLTSDYNYKIYSCRAWFAEAKWANPWPTAEVADILILVFPSYEVGNVGLHAAAAHELGHVLAAKFARELTALVIPAIEKRHLDSPDEKNHAVAERVIKVRGAGDILAAAAWDDIQERLMAVPMQWIIETTADLIAARLVGPAFLAAMERITLAAADASDSHPPDRLRHSYLREYLKSEFPEIAKDHAWDQLLAPRGSEEEDRKRDAALGGEDYIYKVARLVLKDCYPHLKALVKTVKSPLVDDNVSDAERRSLIRSEQHSSRNTSSALTGAASLSQIEQDLMNLVPPSRGFAIMGPEDVASLFWLFFYATWRLRMGSQFENFRKAHGWTNDEGVAERVISSMLLHGLQSLSVSLTVQTNRQSVRSTQHVDQ